MKRAHRNTHRLIWLLMTPALLLVLYLALEARPDDPINNALPELSGEGPSDLEAG